MGIKTWVNGKLFDKDEASINAYDHGFLYGDGVFEGIRIYNGRIFRFSEHIDRFFDSLLVTRIDIGMDRESLKTQIIKVCQENEHYDRAYIRLVASRGVGDLGINPRKCRNGATVV
ncbi:MAG TPA: aminotransferase class IV, partial [bacterium]